MTISNAPLQRQPKLYLHSTYGSPDPSLGHDTTPLGNNRFGMTVHPHALLRSVPVDQETKRWADLLHVHRWPGPLVLTLQNRYAELLLDLGTEVEGWPTLELEALAPVSVVADFGESLEEADGLVFGLTPLPTVSMAAPAGRQRLSLDLVRYRQEGSGGVFGPVVALPGDARPSWMGGRVQRACRFVRLRFVSAATTIMVHGFRVEAEFTGGAPDGHFSCSDPAWQRLWWTSLYTARLCTRPDAFWDGPKRDRSGWYGDARIIQLAWLGGWCDGRPTATMLQKIPTSSWPGGVPGYSADALAMLREQLLTHGDSPDVRSAYARVQDLLRWVDSQCDEHGLLQRHEGVKLFGDIGFTDWSAMPQGGRLEELASPQCKQLELWRLATELAVRLDDQLSAVHWQQRAEKLARVLRERFWRPQSGMVHTLNHVGPVPNPHLPAKVHAQRTYVDGIVLGESGPSRQANALAVLAGALHTDDYPQALDALNSPLLPPVITPYFQWYLAQARAQCGKRGEAVRLFADYLSNHLTSEGTATIWELYDPDIVDLRRFSGHLEQGYEWQLSLCHGWGAGFIPLVANHLAGISSTAPGYRAVRCDPAPGLTVDFQLTIPTPLGNMTIEGDRSGRRLCRVPEGMVVEATAAVEVISESSTRLAVSLA